jgi:hypothetical protein
MTSPSVLLARFRKYGHETLAIGVIGINILPRISARSDVVKRARKFDAQRT